MTEQKSDAKFTTGIVLTLVAIFIGLVLLFAATLFVLNYFANPTAQSIIDFLRTNTILLLDEKEKCFLAYCIILPCAQILFAAVGAKLTDIDAYWVSVRSFYRGVFIMATSVVLILGLVIFGLAKDQGKRRRF